MGYKFYETASDEGLINYDDTVAFPFGYGLSYTSFDQKLDSVKYKGGKVTVTATVTNTGDKAGQGRGRGLLQPAVHRWWHREGIQEPGCVRKDQEARAGALPRP